MLHQLPTRTSVTLTESNNMTVVPVRVCESRHLKCRGSTVEVGRISEPSSFFYMDVSWQKVDTLGRLKTVPTFLEVDARDHVHR